MAFRRSQSGSGEPADFASSRARGWSLWQILTQPDALPISQQDPVEMVKRDVIEHVRILLNAHQGRCSAYPDFGMPDVGEFLATDRGMSRLAAEIERVIERFEPRVEKPVRVTPTGKPGLGPEGAYRAEFDVRVRLAAPWNDRCAFRTTILADGQAQVD